MVILSLLLASFAQASQPILNPKLGKVSAECKVPENPGAKHVWLFKQWHLPSGFDSHDRVKARHFPQALNQQSIYEQLDQWIIAKRLGALVAEGCTGELNRDSPLKINGWSMKELEAASHQPHYDDEIVSSVAMKLEAKHGDGLKALCGDDEALLRENGLALSDARGVVGFMTRLEQYKDDPARAATYLEGVVELYKMPKDTNVGQALKRLHSALRLALDRAEIALSKRNEKAVRTIESISAPEVAVVYGGMHAAGMVRLFEKAGIGCTVIEPKGYEDDEARLLKRIHELVN